MRHILAVTLVGLWLARLAFAEGDAGEKKPKPGPGPVAGIEAKPGDEGDHEGGFKPKPEKGFGKGELMKFLRFGGAPLGKAVIPLGNGASVELNLEEEDLDPDTRAVLLKLLRQQLLKELEKHDPKAAGEYRAALERRAKVEAEERARWAAEDPRRLADEIRERLRDKIRDKLPKVPKPERPEGRGEDGKAQF